MRAEFRKGIVHMYTGNSNGYIAYEKMYHYAMTSKMYDVQPSHFVYAMETFLLLWLLGFMFYPGVISTGKRVLNIHNKNRSVISQRDNDNRSSGPSVNKRRKGKREQK